MLGAISKSLKRLLSLDIFWLNFNLSDPGMRWLDLADSSLPRPGLVRRFTLFWLRAARFGFGVLDLPFLFSRRRQTEMVVLFHCSANQSAVLRPIAARLAAKHRIVGVRPAEGEMTFPRGLSVLLSIPCLPLVAYRYVKGTSYQRRSFKHGFDLYWLTYGYYLTWRLLLWKQNAEMLVVANDHVMFTRTGIAAAKDARVKTCFVSHAAVTGALQFPPLCTDIALLDGEDALRKYGTSSLGHTEVFLIGMPKFDGFENRINLTTRVERVGVCTNGLDPLERVDELCKRLSALHPRMDVKLRPHPAEKNKGQWASMAERHGLGFSDPAIEPAFEFVSRVDAVIAGESSILLEAAMMNVVPVYYDFAGNALDAYWFEKNGLVDRRLSGVEEVVAYVVSIANAKPYVRDRARPYCATVDTPFEGRSAHLAAELIEGKVDASDAGPQWRRLDADDSLSVFEPSPHLSDS